MKKINRKQFLAELGRLLTFMSDEDRATALGIYSDMFDDAGDEQALTGFLISPTRQAVYMARAYNRKPDSVFDPMKEYGEEDDEIGDDRPEYIKALDHARQEAEKAGIVSEYSFVEPAPGEEAPEEPEEEENEDGLPAEEPEEAVVPEEAGKPEETPEESPAEPEKELPAAPGTGGEVKKTRKARPLLLILFLIFAIPLGLIGIVCLLVLAAAALACGAAACAAGIFGVRAALTGFPIVADIIIILGAALICLALGLLFFWLFIWLLFGTVPGMIKWIAALAGRWCYKEVELS